jgi:putative ABC transport system permease protein
MSSISFGVAALVAIDSFSENTTRSVHDESRALTGGDISITANRPFPVRARALIDSLDAGVIDAARVTTFPSMVSSDAATRLVQVRAVSPGYPFYGSITSQPGEAWDSLQHGSNAVVDRAVLLALGLSMGDSVTLGTARFRIAGTLLKVPGDLGITAAIGPRIFIAESEVEGTSLLVMGSRAQYETVLRLPDNIAARTFARRMGERFTTDSLRVRTAGYNEARLSSTIDQMRDFLAVVALVALLLGGVGVASGVHAFVLAKIDTVAILRCVGATSGQVLTIYVAQAAAMGLVGAVAGAALGLALQLVLPRLLEDILPLSVTVQAEPTAIVLGIATGVWVALVFALRPLLGVRLVSPLQALRREADSSVARLKRSPKRRSSPRPWTMPWRDTSDRRMNKPPSPTCRLGPACMWSRASGERRISSAQCRCS